MLMRSIVGRPRRLTTTLALAITLLLYAGAPGVGAAPFVATVLVTGHGILDRGEFAVSGTLFRDSKADGLWGHFMTVKGNLDEPKYVVCLYDDEFVLLGEQVGPDGTEAITAGELALSRTTISWEVLTAMSRRLPRVYHAAAVPVGLRTLTEEVHPWLPTSSSGTETSATSRSTRS